MPMRVTNIDEGGYVGEPPRPPLEHRVQQLEVMMQLIIQHLRGTDRMSDEELEKMEEDLDRTLHPRWPEN